MTTMTKPAVIDLLEPVELDRFAHALDVAGKSFAEYLAKYPQIPASTQTRMFWGLVIATAPDDQVLQLASECLRRLKEEEDGN